jgi:integrase
MSIIKIFETFMKRDYFEEILKKDFHFKIYKNFNVTFSNITKELFKKRSTSHILRKSRATFLLRNNVPIIQVKNFLGHKKLETTMRYLASEYEDLNKSIMVIGDIS